MNPIAVGKRHKRKRGLDPGDSASKFEVLSDHTSLDLPPIKLNTDDPSQTVTTDFVDASPSHAMSPNSLPAIKANTDIITKDCDISSSQTFQTLPAIKLHRNVVNKKPPPVVTQQRSRLEDDIAQASCDPSALSPTLKKDPFWHTQRKVAVDTHSRLQQEGNTSQALCDPSTVSPIPSQDRSRLLFQREDTAPIALLSHVNRRRRRYARALNGIESQRLASVHRCLDRARETTERRVTRQAEKLRQALSEIDAAEENRRRKWRESENGALVSSRESLPPDPPPWRVTKTTNTQSKARKRNPLMKTKNPPPRLSSSSCPPFAFSSVAAEEPLGRWVRYPEVLPTLVETEGDTHGETVGETLREIIGDGMDVKVGSKGRRKHSIIREDSGEDIAEEV